MKIFIFLLITFNLYSYLSKSERYPREYTYYERQKFMEVYKYSGARWREDVKFIPLRFVFGGTPKERIYIKRSIEEINKIFNNIKRPLIRVIFQKNIHDDSSAWDPNILSIKNVFTQEQAIQVLILPNIKEWGSINPKTGSPVLGDASSSSAGIINSDILKFKGLARGIITVYTNIIYEENANENFHPHFYLEHRRIQTFNHELLHTLGFDHITGINSIMIPSSSINSVKFTGYIYGILYWDIIFLEMKYNKVFDTYEDEEDFIEKLYTYKMRRPDRRSRREKLLYPVTD